MTYKPHNIIDEFGAVESAVMKSSVTPRYDVSVVNAAKGWKYQPATLNGTPVRFRKTINISVKAAGQKP